MQDNQPGAHDAYSRLGYSHGTGAAPPHSDGPSSRLIPVPSTSAVTPFGAPPGAQLASQHPLRRMAPLRPPPTLYAPGPPTYDAAPSAHPGACGPSRSNILPALRGLPQPAAAVESAGPSSSTLLAKPLFDPGWARYGPAGAGSSGLPPVEPPAAPGERRTKKGWSKEDDQRLEAAVRLHMDRQAADEASGIRPRSMTNSPSIKSWAKIAETAFPHGPYDKMACSSRWRTLRRPTSNRGQWSKSEDALLVATVQELGVDKWAMVAERLGTRTAKQCRERWNNHADPSINKDPFTDEENARILDMYRKFGSKWSEMARHLPGRPDNRIKNHYNTLLRPRARTNTKRSYKARNSFDTNMSTSASTSTQEMPDPSFPSASTTEQHRVKLDPYAPRSASFSYHSPIASMDGPPSLSGGASSASAYSAHFAPYGMPNGVVGSHNSFSPSLSQPSTASPGMVGSYYPADPSYSVASSSSVLPSAEAGLHMPPLASHPSSAPPLPLVPPGGPYYPGTGSQVPTRTAASSMRIPTTLAEPSAPPYYTDSNSIRHGSTDLDTNPHGW